MISLRSLGIPTKYFREVMVELKKVSWPSRQQTINMTLLVVVASSLVALYVGGLDYIFSQMITNLIK